MKQPNGVLVAGAINTDLVARVQRAPAPGETVTGSEFNVFGGGKGANQALSCARSGARTAMLGAVGDDEFGRQRVTDLIRDGIDVSGVVTTSAAASGVALIVVEDSGQNRIAYVPGATQTISVEQALQALGRSNAGIVLSTLELPHDSLFELFRTARSAGSMVIVNATPEPANGRDLLRHADVLIANETEALELLGRDRADDWLRVAQELVALGPAWVIITVGSEGAISLYQEAVHRVKPPAVQVVDTTGAGDAFCGAFAARLSEGASAVDAVRAGVAAGSLAVTVAGAQRSMPKHAEVDRMIDNVLIEEC